MKWYHILLSFVLILSIVFSVLYFVHPRTIFIEKPITQIQFIPSKPDTVYIKKTIVKPLKPDTIYYTEIHSEVKDTIISEIVFQKETQIGIVKSFIQASAFCPVEKFSNKIEVDQTKFQEALKRELEKQKTKTNAWRTTAQIGIPLGVGLFLGAVIIK